MTTLPLATLACTIDGFGIQAPQYVDVLGSLQVLYRSIFGSDAYLDPDSQDGQWLAIIAQAITDCNMQTIATYNAFSPSFALGAGLSSVVKINGITRLVATSSSVTVTVFGQPGTQIVNGIVGDNQQLRTQWALPSLVVIPVGGQIDQIATCTRPGSFTALAGTLTAILTPTAGWQTVTNVADAAPGAPVESDGALRQRQTISTSLPAQSTLDGIIATVANLSGVQEVRAYENTTNQTDINGVPGHSIALVVNGGDVTAICNAIALKKPPGTGTYGTTSQVVVDPLGVPSLINFFTMQTTQVYVAITVQALNGYSSLVGTNIVKALIYYINSLAIGEPVYFNRLFAPANLTGDAAVLATGLSQAQLDLQAATFNITSLFISITPTPVTTNNIIIPFNAAASATNNVILTAQ